MRPHSKKEKPTDNEEWISHNLYNYFFSIKKTLRQVLYAFLLYIWKGWGLEWVQNFSMDFKYWSHKFLAILTPGSLPFLVCPYKMVIIVGLSYTYIWNLDDLMWTKQEGDNKACERTQVSQPEGENCFKLTQPCCIHPNKEGAHYQWRALAQLAPSNAGYASKTMPSDLLPLSIVFSHALEINKTSFLERVCVQLSHSSPIHKSLPESIIIFAY